MTRLAAALLFVALLAAGDEPEDAPSSCSHLEWLPTLNPIGAPLSVAWMPHLVCDEFALEGR